MSPLRGIREIWLRLKTSSYLFMKTENTGQVSVGVVKAPGVLHKKTATQHWSCWLLQFEREPEMDVCFQGKTIDCIRVDGGADEGPSHLEVQFRWTEWHLIEGREFTLVTTRNSGTSCFNLVSSIFSTHGTFYTSHSALCTFCTPHFPRPRNPHSALFAPCIFCTPPSTFST